MVFHCFAILCVIYSCISIWNLAIKFNELEPEAQESCQPYAIWKSVFLTHVVFFFISMSFALGTCDTFLNEEDPEIEVANNEDVRESTTRLVERSIKLLKYHCMMFCGPFVLIESVLSCVYYQQILNGCQSHIKDPLTSTLIYLIIIMLCISVTACLYCSYMSFLCVKAGKRALPTLRDVSNW